MQYDHAIARKLQRILEPIAGCVYFAPEPTQNYKSLGLNYFEGYFLSRSACMGKLNGETVAAVFGAFNPEVVIPVVTSGWAKTNPEHVLTARLDGAEKALRRMVMQDFKDLKDFPDEAIEVSSKLDFSNAPIFAGLRSLTIPNDPAQYYFRGADLIREYRGAIHNCVWQSMGLRSIEASLLTEAWWKYPLKSYVFTRGWSEPQINEALEDLCNRGFFKEPGEITQDGLELREEIETKTDQLVLELLVNAGADVEKWTQLISPVSDQIVHKGGFPSTPEEMTEKIRKNL